MKGIELSKENDFSSIWYILQTFHVDPKHSRRTNHKPTKDLELLPHLIYDALSLDLEHSCINQSLSNMTTVEVAVLSFCRFGIR